MPTALTLGRWTCNLLPEAVKVKQANQTIGEYPLLKEPYCHRCGSPGKETHQCTWHSQFSVALTRIFAVGPYYPLLNHRKSLLGEHINYLKNDVQYAVPLGLAMSLVMLSRHRSELRKFEVAAPIPLHPDSLRTRRYNQSQELAKIVCANCNIQLTDLLTKVKEVKMRQRNMFDRWRDVKGIYSCNGNCRGEAVLLIDDVTTSGATLSECADVLSQKGAREVSALVAGRDAPRY